MTITKKWAWLPAVFLISAVSADGALAQEKQRQQGTQHRQQRDQDVSMNRSPFPDDVLEDLLVIRLAERSNLTRVIKASVKEGVATLSGKVPDAEAKRRALRIVRATPGIMSVRDEINIDSSMTRAISETERKVGEKELVKQVAEKIAANIEGTKAGKDWWFEGWRVEGRDNEWNLIVEVDQPGFVVLEGEVPSLDIMRKAVEAAAQVPGVRAVDTDMELERFHARYYPYAYYPYAFYPYYGPHAFGPYAWHPPVAFDSSSSSNDRQAGSRIDAQQQGQ
jgi:hypothetical protein